MKEKELPGWLETLYNTNPGLAERAEKYIDTVWNEAIEAAAKVGYKRLYDIGEYEELVEAAILKLKR